MAKEKYCVYNPVIIQIKDYYIWFIIINLQTWLAVELITWNNRYLTRGAESTSWGLKHFGIGWWCSQLISGDNKVQCPQCIGGAPGNWDSVFWRSVVQSLKHQSRCQCWIPCSLHSLWREWGSKKRNITDYVIFFFAKYIFCMHFHFQLPWSVLKTTGLAHFKHSAWVLNSFSSESLTVCLLPVWEMTHQRLKPCNIKYRNKYITSICLQH